eukprot:TRINITY_DN3281_c0_g1_i1.p1 TRINITY_DN3281_c0_g1~~TRINITY_DN3281_c0_g1_i1.p1  ORF type:complete len:799 (-),score=234.08 TRINITY_DN3281_c0_g1_i1:117-2513(-)
MDEKKTPPKSGAQRTTERERSVKKMDPEISQDEEKKREEKKREEKREKEVSKTDLKSEAQRKTESKADIKIEGEKEKPERPRTDTKGDDKKASSKSKKPKEGGQDDDYAEIKELEALGESIPELQLKLVHLHSEITSAYERLIKMASQMNVPISSLEIVLIGPQGSGKSYLLEGLLGHQFNIIGHEGATKRPLYIYIRNNPDCSKPRCTLKRDPLSQEHQDRDCTVEMAEMPSELQNRNKSFSEEGIFVHIELKDAFNITFIDTPGIIKEDQGDLSKAKIDALIHSLARVPHRILLFVEEAKEWEQVYMPEEAKKFDPELSRSIFVYTNFNAHLQKFTSPVQVNKYLASATPEVKNFFVSMPNEKVRAKFTDSDKWAEKVWQVQKRDFFAIEALSFDKRLESYIGVFNLRHYLINLAWKSYQDGVPRILHTIRAKKEETDNQHQKIQDQLNSLECPRLRAIASVFVTEFLQLIERLIEGTSEGNPAVNGQTLDEEKNACGDCEWVDAQNRPIKKEYDAEENVVVSSEHKLYGGQQFERLLHEFHSALEKPNSALEIHFDDIATAAGINRINNIPNYAWAACDIATHKAKDTYLPLIETLINRAVYIMKRLADMAEKIMDSRKQTRYDIKGSILDVEKIEQYPYFIYYVKDVYYKFVESTGKICLEKCLDEFYHTRTIYWGQQQEVAYIALSLERNDPDNKVLKVAQDLFKTLQTRITKNVLLKCYNFFLVPLQTQLWTHVQGKITSLTDADLKQIFEMDVMKKKVADDASHLDLLSKQLSDYESQLIENAQKFAHHYY